MFENQPALVKEYLDSNKLGELEKLLDRKLQSALSLVLRLKKEGASEDEAFQVATERSWHRATGQRSATTHRIPCRMRGRGGCTRGWRRRELSEKKARGRRSKM